MYNTGLVTTVMNPCRNLTNLRSIENRSLLIDSFKLALSRVHCLGYSEVLSWRPLSHCDTISTFALYQGLYTPSSLQKRLGLEEYGGLWTERDANSMDGILLEVEMQSDVKEYDSGCPLSSSIVTIQGYRFIAILLQ